MKVRYAVDCINEISMRSHKKNKLFKSHRLSDLEIVVTSHDWQEFFRVKSGIIGMILSEKLNERWYNVFIDGKIGIMHMSDIQFL